MPASADAASANAARSSSAPDRVFGNPVTIVSSAAPTDEASAAADPPPGVGSDEASAEIRSRTGLSISTLNDLALLDHPEDCVGADAHQVDRRPGDDHRVHLFADFEAADVSVPVERIRRVDRGADQRLLEGQ